MLQANDWEEGVNEKTFPAKPSPDNSFVGLEHDGDEQTIGGCIMFNMILRDGTRSDNPMIWDDGEVYEYGENVR